MAIAHMPNCSEPTSHFFNANGAVFNESLGQRPRVHGIPEASALKAQFTFGASSVIIRVVSQSLSKVSFTSSLARRIANHGSTAECDDGCTPTLAAICRDLGADFARVGGVADHVHIVTTLPRPVSQAELIEQIKKTSAK